MPLLCRFLHECPWERLEEMRKLIPNIPFQAAGPLLLYVVRLFLSTFSIFVSTLRTLIFHGTGISLYIRYFRPHPSSFYPMLDPNQQGSGVFAGSRSVSKSGLEILFSYSSSRGNYIDTEVKLAEVENFFCMVIKDQIPVHIWNHLQTRIRNKLVGSESRTPLLPPL
jgi:hypothetical protein